MSLHCWALEPSHLYCPPPGSRLITVCQRGRLPSGRLFRASPGSVTGGDSFHVLGLPRHDWGPLSLVGAPVRLVGGGDRWDREAWASPTPAPGALLGASASALPSQTRDLLLSTERSAVCSQYGKTQPPGVVLAEPELLFLPGPRSALALEAAPYGEAPPGEEVSLPTGLGSFQRISYLGQICWIQWVSSKQPLWGRSLTSHSVWSAGLPTNQPRGRLTSSPSGPSEAARRRRCPLHGRLLHTLRPSTSSSFTLPHQSSCCSASWNVLRLTEPRSPSESSSVFLPALPVAVPLWWTHCLLLPWWFL